MFALLVFLLPLMVTGQNFFTAQLAPATLTSVPYLNGEITVYEHKANQSRYYLPPLAILHLNDTHVLFNRFTNRYSVRLALVLYTEELRQTVLDYLRTTLNRCPKEIQCQIKMIPIDRLRIVWKRLQALSSDYELDSSWMSNTILLSTIYFNICCTSQSACLNLREDILQNPEIVDGLELEYSTPTEKHLRKDVTITGSHVMKTNMFSSLKQMPTAGDVNTRYLLADDMNQLISEVLTSVEITDVTDAGFVSHDDQTIMRDMLKNRIALNQEVLLGHTARQWDSVFWNSDNVRPDHTVKFLNEQLSRKQHKTSGETETVVDANTAHLNQTSISSSRASFDDASAGLSSTNDTSGSKHSDTSHSHTNANQKASSQMQDNSGSSSSSSNQQRSNAGSSYSSSSGSSGGGRSGGFLFFGGSSRASSNHASANQNAHSSSDSSAVSNSQSNRNMFSQASQSADFKANAQNEISSDSHRNFLQKVDSNTDVRARQAAFDDHHKLAEMDRFAERNLDKAALDKYDENRQYMEFTGNKFDVKPLLAYRVNLGQFHETLKLISKSIVVQRIDSIHAVPIRSLAEPVLLTPLIERYKTGMDDKLVELKKALLDSIQNTFMNYKQEVRTLLDETMLSTTGIIHTALVTDVKNNTDTNLRFLIKKALTNTMKLQDIGLFDNGILDYYRHHATPIERITVTALQPLKIGLHFPNVYVEGMVCDDQFDKNDARIACQMFRNSQNVTASFTPNIINNQTAPTCSFKTNYINEQVPCPFVMSTLDCLPTHKTFKECKYQRPLHASSHSCQPNEHVNVFC